MAKYTCKGCGKVMVGENMKDHIMKKAGTGHFVEEVVK